MDETTTKTTTQGNGEAKGSPYQAALTASTHLRDATSAVALLVRDGWHGGVTADRARNAIDWIAEKMEEECDALDEALGTIEIEARS